MRRTALLLFMLAAATVLCAAQSKKVAQKPVPAPSRHTAAAPALPPLNSEERAIQMLNRFTFGPRPGDVEAVMKMGPDAWFEQQLNPDSIPDPILDKRLADYPSLYLPPNQLLAEFPSNQMIRQTAEGKRPYPPDPVEAGAYEVLLAKYNKRKAEQEAQQGAAQAGTNVAGQATVDMTPDMAEAQKATHRKQQQAAAAVLADEVLAFPKDERIQALMKMPVDQRATLAEFVPDPQRGLLINDFNPRQKELFNLMAGGPDGMRVIDNELQQAKVVRAVLSERQLQEVMTDFWYNHFNVDIRKEATQWYTPTYERDAIRAHALGKFRDLLLATAQNPAMLFYLDNWSSIGPDSMAAGRPNQKKQQRGLNENYGREVMELHTVGVNGGYSQADVTNLAKIMTGWTIDQPQQGGGFVFDARKHEPGSKQWFGQKVSENGYEEGQRALEWLAAQPQTAHFICLQISSALRRRRSSRGTGRPHGEDVYGDRWRHQRDPPDDGSFARIQLSEVLPREGEDTAGIRRIRFPCDRHKSVESRSSRGSHRPHGRAALPDAAAHRILDDRRPLDEFSRHRRPPEFLAPVRQQQSRWNQV